MAGLYFWSFHLLDYWLFQEDNVAFLQPHPVSDPLWEDALWSAEKP